MQPQSDRPNTDGVDPVRSCRRTRRLDNPREVLQPERSIVLVTTLEELEGDVGSANDRDPIGAHGGFRGYEGPRELRCRTDSDQGDAAITDFGPGTGPRRCSSDAAFQSFGRPRPVHLEILIVRGGRDRCRSGILGDGWGRPTRSKGGRDLAQERETRAIEPPRELPGVPSGADAHFTLSEDGARVVLGLQSMCGDSRHLVTAVDGPKERIGSPMTGKKGWVDAYGRSQIEQVGRQFPRPKPTDDEIGGGRAHPIVRLGEVDGRAKPRVSRRDVAGETAQARTTTARGRVNDRMPVCGEQYGGQGEPEEGDSQAARRGPALTRA